MDFEKFLITLILFLFSIFLFPDLEAAIGAISPSETLIPIFNALPIIWIGALFVSLAYWGFSRNE